MAGSEVPAGLDRVFVVNQLKNVNIGLFSGDGWTGDLRQVRLL